MPGGGKAEPLSRELEQQNDLLSISYSRDDVFLNAMCRDHEFVVVADEEPTLML